MPELRGILTPDDSLTLTIRLHDPKEKKDPKKAAQWVTVKVYRADLSLPKQEFIQKYIAPKLAEIKNLTGN